MNQKLLIEASLCMVTHFKKCLLVVLFREANWKSQKLFPFVKTTEKLYMYPGTLKQCVLYITQVVAIDTRLEYSISV